MSTPITNIKGQPAVRVPGKILYKSTNGKSSFIDFEGEKEWMNNEYFRVDKDAGTIDIPKWFCDVLDKKAMQKIRL